ncbi:MAG: tetratricopeptide repeat protein [Planctomycetota bacterium]
MKIGDYEILSTLGKGGMGVVYRARAVNGQIVAVKVLIELTGDKRQRFERETRLLEQLGEAEGFIPLLDAGDTGREPYIVMPFVTGGTLRDRLDRGPLGIEETARLGRELARALGNAHALGIIHRDLKPENILYNSSGRALVADLGLAKHYDGEALGASRSVDMSVSGMWRGTPGYMAPEQMKDAKTCGPAADVFALGAILHECIAGEKAFDGEGLVDVLQKVEKGERRPLRRARPEVPPALEAAIDKALEPDEARRFPDANALARALDKDFIAPSRSLALPILGGLALLVGGGAVVLWLALGERRPQPPSPPKPPAPPVAPPVPPPFPPTDVAARAKELLENAARKLAREDAQGAIEDATKVIDLDPKNALAWLVRGVARGSANDPDGSLDDIGRAIEISPSASAFAARAVTHMGQGHIEPAIDDYGRAIELERANPVHWHHRGELYFRRDRLAEALADLIECVRLDPESTDAWFLLGAVRDKQGDLEMALDCFERALKTGNAKSLENAWRALTDLKKRLSTQLGLAGEAAYNRKEYDLAIALCTKSLYVNPKNVSSYIDRGVSFGEKGCHDLAIADYTTALEISPNLPEAYSNRGATRNKKGDTEGAIADYDKALSIRADFSPPYMNRGIVRDKLGDEKGAIEDFKKYLELEPNTPNKRFLNARIAALESRINTKR